MSWTNRVSHSPRTPPLRQVQAAAENLADHAGIAPGRTRVVFGIVTDVVILTSAFIGGALGAVHLWKMLSSKHKDDPHRPEPAAGDGAPPRRRGPPVATAFADRHDGHDHRGHHYR
jgi:hypothetical protein